MEISGDIRTGRSVPARPAGIQVQGQIAGRMPGAASPAVTAAPLPKPGALLPPARSQVAQASGRLAFANGTPPGQLSPPRGGASFGSMIPQGAYPPAYGASPGDASGQPSGNAGGPDVQSAKGAQADAQSAQAGDSGQAEMNQNKHEIVMKYIDGARG